MATQETAKLVTPPLDSLLLHQCPTQRGQYTHPAFVGQECQESRQLPSSLLLPNKVLPLLPSSPSSISLPTLQRPGGFPGVWVAAVWFDAVFSLRTVNITASVWSNNTCSEEVSSGTSFKPEGHSFGLCNILKFDEVFQGGLWGTEV